MVVAGHHRDQRGFVEKLGLAIERVVVGSVKWTYQRPLHAGDALHGIRRVVSDEQRSGKRGTLRLVTLVTEYVDADGVVALRQREVLIERGARRMRKPLPVQIGDSAPAREIGPITQTDIVRFAGGGGDFNPLHHDPEFARSSGFPDVLAMGQFQAGILAGWLSDWLGVEHLREYEVRFAAPVFLGDVLRFSGEIVSITETDGESLAEVALTATRGTDPAVTATALVAVTPT